MHDVERVQVGSALCYIPGRPNFEQCRQFAVVSRSAVQHVEERAVGAELKHHTQIYPAALVRLLTEARRNAHEFDHVWVLNLGQDRYLAISMCG